MGRRAVRPLAQALALQRDFVADASHELRTPLTLLSTRAQLLARSLQDTDVGGDIREDSRGVVRDTSRMVAVVDDLLLAADAGAPGPIAVPVDLGLLCRSWPTAPGRTRQSAASTWWPSREATQS